METDGARDNEENFLTSLKGCYGEYVDLLRQLAVAHVQIDGSPVEVGKIFEGELTLEELRSRRNLAVRKVPCIPGLCISGLRISGLYLWGSVSLGCVLKARRAIRVPPLWT